MTKKDEEMCFSSKCYICNLLVCQDLLNQEVWVLIWKYDHMLEVFQLIPVG